MMQIKKDPTNSYPDMDEHALLDFCGLLPAWIEYAIAQDKLSVWDSLEKSYGFPLYEIKETEITGTGMWKYPEDPDLPPFVEFSGNDKKIYVYPYGMVAIKEAGKEAFQCTRMD